MYLLLCDSVYKPNKSKPHDHTRLSEPLRIPLEEKGLKVSFKDEKERFIDAILSEYII